MRKLRLDISKSPRELRAGLSQVAKRRPQSFGSTGIALRFQRIPNATQPHLDVRTAGREITISYSRPVDAFRGLGRVLGGSTNFTESCAFDLLAVLVDCSRNGVLRPETAEDLLVTLALMGFNGFVPYMEDTFEVPGEPFFGYLRGRYTREELKRLDDFAFALGIEVSPCIQVLGHLEQLLQWPAYAHLRDVPGVLLADHPPAYAQIEKMIRAATSPLRSRRIYAAMDEAHGLGTGRYRAMFGQKSPFDILNRHMRKVVAICNRLGLKPMTSGDMYFRVGSKHNAYYDVDSVIPPRVAKQIPREMQLVYWDYYHTDRAFYEDWIDRHRAMGKEPIISGGVWTWSHFWAALPFSFATTDALMAASKAKGIRENVCCLWGDDGMECDLLSALPGLQHYADHAYGASPPTRAISSKNLRGSADVDFDAFVEAARVDQLPMLADPKEMPGNCSKWLLWEDPVLGLMGPQLGARGASAAAKYYEGLERRLRLRGNRMDFPRQLALVLSMKVALHPRIALAMRKRDRRTVSRIARNDLPKIRREVDKLWKIHRAVWLDLYKPFGLETLDGRYGRLVARLDTLADRLRDYLARRINSIPELEAKLEKIYPNEDVLTLWDHARAATPSVIR